MSGYWVLKTEPSTYGFDDLVRERTAAWDGVRNPVALRNMREMQPGDRVVIYHTGDEKAAVGLAEVVKAAYPDPRAVDPALVAVDLKAGGRLPRPVTLAAIRQEPAFADLALVRQPRLSVVPCSAAQYRRLLELAEAR